MLCADLGNVSSLGTSFPICFVSGFLLDSILPQLHLLKFTSTASAYATASIPVSILFPKIPLALLSQIVIIRTVPLSPKSHARDIFILHWI